jgi:hypothetical protein
VGAGHNVVIEPNFQKILILKIIEMKKQIALLLVAFIVCTTTFAQELKDREFICYSFLLNNVPDGFNIPQIGFVNIGRGSQESAQIGFVNTNKNNFEGIQTGFINYNGKKFNGSQIGFVNVTGDDFFGAQVGFINFGADSVKGAQIGFINTALKKTDAVQVGFINTAKSLSRLQIGFINVVDTITSGFPIGFVSVVKKGGYHAFELSVNEMFPLNFAYKIGISKLYSSIILSYNPTGKKSIAIGGGLGSIFPLGKRILFVPEFSSQTLLFNHFQQIQNLTPNIGFNINQHLSILTGPSLTWQYGKNVDEYNEPFFSFRKKSLKDMGNLIVGARFAVRYKI